ncbi:hypothetical protein Q8A67_011280 [Cirrhinus molitorella]|uniref:Uncharacterized protein n=1 Tax=Cirrhinus molitorella TaxID=172907 RepID=A0AA88PUM8_9TELE|nr:hypothetical protein Q8A67_011280 [Cirrhinus molitorella]
MGRVCPTGTLPDDQYSSCVLTQLSLRCRALRSKWLITNLTPGNLEARAHLRSLRGPLHRESDRREKEKWNCQPGCYADTLGANRMKLSGVSWEAVHIKVILFSQTCIRFTLLCQRSGPPLKRRRAWKPAWQEEIVAMLQQGVHRVSGLERTKQHALGSVTCLAAADVCAVPAQPKTKKISFSAVSPEIYVSNGPAFLRSRFG